MLAPGLSSSSFLCGQCQGGALWKCRFTRSSICVFNTPRLAPEEFYLPTQDMPELRSGWLVRWAVMPKMRQWAKYWPGEHDIHISAGYWLQRGSITAGGTLAGTGTVHMVGCCSAS
ncbi:hypothetical protein GGX14DRAFT_400914 [Mycena pura]|uniref:Uncharacterized protein n=1 Tax=Mycena pura TaxID=153505 RepID=A0AAD6Y574_9AGAR|nr:hypothetical protein GGX14DRAFT_400914 [Mycena pura]